MDYFGLGNTTLLYKIKYISILLCFIISLLANNEENIRDTRLLQIGLFFTTIADLFLVILENYYLGVITFTIVQIIYIARYSTRDIKSTYKKLSIIFISIFSIYFVISKLFLNIEFVLIPLGLFYAICLFISTIKSIKISRDSSYLNPNKYMLAWGMVLFLLCDVNIVVSYILKMNNLLILSNLSSDLIWIFYLPSQVLLSISGYGGIGH